MRAGTVAPCLPQLAQLPLPPIAQRLHKIACLPFIAIMLHFTHLCVLPLFLASQSLQITAGAVPPPASMLAALPAILPNGINLSPLF